MRKIIILCLLFFSFAVHAYDYELVSIINLISSPDKYQNKKIAIIGYIDLSFESTALYLSEGDYKNSITKNAIYIDLHDGDLLKGIQSKKNITAKNGEVVFVSGVFNKEKGHFDMYSGLINNIAKIHSWPAK